MSLNTDQAVGRKADGEMRITFAGDSITSAGRNSEFPLGEGFVSLFYSASRHSGMGGSLAITNAGISGDTVLHLAERWDVDVIGTRPDVVVVQVGINDLHSFLTRPCIYKVPPCVFERTLDELMARVTRHLPKVRLLLVEPFYLCLPGATSDNDRLRMVFLPDYQAAMARRASVHNAQFVGTQAAFERELRLSPREKLAPNDPVHPGSYGAAMIAKNLLDCFLLQEPSAWRTGEPVFREGETGL